MAKFKVLTIGHQLRNKIVAGYGTEVDESQLMGNADALVKAGFIEPLDVDTNDADLDKLGFKELVSFAKLNDVNVDGLKSKSSVIAAIDAHLNELEVSGAVVVETEETE